MIYRRFPDGAWQLFGGLVEVDPDWRSRDLFAGYEPSEGREPKKLTRVERLLSMVCETNIEFILGKPGGGKSMFATKMLVDELLYSHRPIVTNLALNLVQLQDYLFSLGRHDIEVCKRVRILTHEEVYRFYLIRGHSLELPAPTASDGLIDWEPSGKSYEAAGGIFYVIDEAHNYFPTKAKIEEDSPMFKWASQHRKLKDYCYFVTQSVENIHAKVRRLGQLFNYIRNLRKETFRGFRRGDGFQRLAFLSIPSGVRDEDIACVNEKFRLDVRGLAACYFTAGGVGMSGKGVADGGFQKKGVHLRWLYGGVAGAVVVLTLVIFVVPMLTAKAGGSYIKTRMVGGKSEPANDAVTLQAVAPAASPPVSAVAPGVHAGAAKAPIVVPGEVTATGYVILNRRFRVQLSDGRTLDEFDGEVETITSSRVKLKDGRVFPLLNRYKEKPAPLPAFDVRPADVVQAVAPLPVAPVSAGDEEWDASTGPVGVPSGRIGR